MKKSFKIILFIAMMLVAGLVAASCKPVDPPIVDPPEQEDIDYASQLKLDMTSETVKQEVTVKNFVDGDTTHFYCPKTISEDGVLKARYLAIDTPESTGNIEPWGKKAANFTKSKLEKAVSIIVESNDSKWNIDGTSTRLLVWVWYKEDSSSEYRNLNLEILQNGLAFASGTGSTRYGEVCLQALSQARTQKLNMYSDGKDPDFYYGEAKEITLKELRCNIEEYNGVKVAFEAVVIRNYSNSAYVESYDPETGLYYGISVYYGFNLNGDGIKILSVGNLVRIVGKVSYYETGGTYQISDVKYLPFTPNPEENLKLIEEGHNPNYTEIDPEKFTSGKVSIEFDDQTKEFSYAELIMNTSVSLNNLVVKSIYTTTNDDSSSKGAMTITCEINGYTIQVRTVVLYDENNDLVTSEMFEGKTLDVKGVVDYFDGEYQIKVFSLKNITIH